MKTRLTMLLVVLLLVAAPAMRAAEEQAGGEHTDFKETVFKWLNFALVFGVGGYFAAPWLKKEFAGQRAAIQAAIQEAREARERSRARLGEVEQRLARLEQEVEALRKEAAENAAAEKQRIHQATQRESDRILATTRAEMESATRAAHLELRAYTARLAVSLAEQNIRQQMTPQTHAALFQAFVGDVSRARIRARRQGPEAVAP